MRSNRKNTKLKFCWCCAESTNLWWWSANGNSTKQHCHGCNKLTRSQKKVKITHNLTVALNVTFAEVVKGIDL